MLVILKYSHPLTYIVFPRLQYVKPSAQIHMYNAEHVLELLNSDDKELMLDNLFKIWKQSTLEEAEEPQPKH